MPKLILNNERIFPSGPWDEEAFLLTGKDPQNVPNNPGRVLYSKITITI